LVIHGTHFLIVGAGAAGLMTARELARSGKTHERMRMSFTAPSPFGGSMPARTP
jgi:hypothetical protein